ncbi:MAG TPA: DUF2313 domain-containing protein, partial [Desulfobacterales bacterium]|nr:DUF2313 domain-containing protein [Desulfobacterales bacterium]
MIFENLDIDKQSTLLASHLPVGRVWEQAFSGDSNIGKLIAGLAVEFYRIELQTGRIASEIDVHEADQLLEDWEKSVGIPNFYFNTNTSICSLPHRQLRK